MRKLCEHFSLNFLSRLLVVATFYGKKSMAIFKENRFSTNLVPQLSKHDFPRFRPELSIKAIQITLFTIRAGNVIAWGLKVTIRI